MSVLDRLRELVSTIDPEDSTTQIEKETEEITEESPEQGFPDYIECTREETVLVLSHRENAKKSRLSLSTLVIQFEKSKQELLSIIKKQENMFFQSLNDLREKKGIPEDGYSASVPEIPTAPIVFEKE